MKLGLLLIVITLFLIGIINLFVSLVIFIAEDVHKAVDFVKINQVFQTERYKKLRSYLMKEQYVILIGQSSSGVKNFIEHQANIQSQQGKGVVLKRYMTNNKKSKRLVKTMKETHFYMQMVLGVRRRQRTQVFFLEDYEEIPIQQIQFIRDNSPHDNIIIVSDEPIDTKLKKFKQKKFPAVTKEELKHAMLHYYDIKDKLAEKLFEQYHDDVGQIMQHFQEKAHSQAAPNEEIVDVEDIQKLNRIAHEIAQKQLAFSIQSQAVGQKNLKISSRDQRKKRSGSK